MVNKINWHKGVPKETGGLFLTAINFPSATVYEVLSRSKHPVDGHFWGGFDSIVGEVVAYAPLDKVLIEITGVDVPEKKAEIDDVFYLEWLQGDLPKDCGPLLVSTPIEYDIVEWLGDEIGWPSYIQHVKGYLPLKEMLKCVAENFPYKED